jgi:phosphoglycerate dehydrogenase-like enzyme
MKQKIILDPHFRQIARTFTEEDLERLTQMAEVIWGRDEPMPPEAIAEVKDEVVAVVSANWRHGDVREFPRLRAIMEVSGRFPDFDTLDYEACFARGIRVLSCASSFAPVVAEMALALALAGARQVASGDAAMHTGSEIWWKPESTANTFTLFDQVVGFIGFGSIARVLKALLAPFRCPIQVYDPWLTNAFLRTQGVAPVALGTLLETSKVIFVLAAPTESNQAMLNRERLERIPPDALLVLISRAHVVDFDALTDLLMVGRLKAAIDVFPIEPLPPDHPIRNAPNTILSAHRAGGTAEGQPFIGSMVVNDLEAILAGNPPQQMQVAQPEIIRLRGACRK